MKHTDKVVIGITGGAGSGKSRIVEYLKDKYDIEYIHCDKIAHDLMEPDGATYWPLLKEYGMQIIDEKNPPHISRAKLTKAIAASKEGFKRVNEITHPIVTEEVKYLIGETSRKLVIVEAALLLESEIHMLCDEIWYVYATEEERKKRLKSNRNYSDEKIEELLKNQLSEEEFKRRSDFIIPNHDGSDEGFFAAEKRIKERFYGFIM